MPTADLSNGTVLNNSVESMELNGLGQSTLTPPRNVEARQSIWSRVAALMKAGAVRSGGDTSLEPRDPSEMQQKRDPTGSSSLSALPSVLQDAGAGMAHVLTPEGRRTMGAAVSEWIQRVPVARAAVSAVSSTVQLLVSALIPRTRTDALKVEFSPEDTRPRVDLCEQASEAALNREFNNGVDAAAKGGSAEDLNKKLAKAVAEALDSMGSARAREEESERGATEARQERERGEVVRQLAETLEQIDALSGRPNGITLELLRRVWSWPYLPDVSQMVALARQAEASEIAEIARVVRDAVSRVSVERRAQPGVVASSQGQSEQNFATAA